MVDVVRKPTRWAVSITSSHCAVLILSGQMTARTSSSRISAAVPGSVPRPASLEAHQVFLERQVGGRRALPDLQRRESVDVHLGHGFLHRMQDVDVGGAGVLRMDAALHADFGAAPVPGLAGAALDLLVAQVVGPAA